MKAVKYIGIRSLIFLIIFILIYNGAYYTIPKYIREDGYGFVALLDRILYLNFIFSILFFIFLLTEIHIFKKRQEIKLQKVAIIYSVFVGLLVIILIFLIIIY